MLRMSEMSKMKVTTKFEGKEWEDVRENTADKDKKFSLSPSLPRKSFSFCAIILISTKIVGKGRVRKRRRREINVVDLV